MHLLRPTPLTLSDADAQVVLTFNLIKGLSYGYFHVLFGSKLAQILTQCTFVIQDYRTLRVTYQVNFQRQNKP